MSILNLISLLAGLSLFLYGITLMGDGLNLVAGNKLEVFLYRLTSNRFRGVLLGTLVTAVIQSSSATSIMCVGFVNSGLMRFSQAVAVILGSILGTSITGWMLTLSSVGGAAADGWSCCPPRPSPASSPWPASFCASLRKRPPTVIWAIS